VTKSEQTVYDRVKARNDLGAAHFGEPVAKVGHQKANMMGRGYRPGKPSKLEQAAFERLLERGEILNLHQGYVVKDHPVLQTLAANINLAYLARHVEEMRQNLCQAEANFEKAQAFVRLYGLGLNR
jgi:hypothetical protein